MSAHYKKGQREKDLTSRYLADDLDDDFLPSRRQFSARIAEAGQVQKMENTALLRATEAALVADVGDLLKGQVTQVFSLYYQVQTPEGPWLCVLRTVSETLYIAAPSLAFRNRSRMPGANCAILRHLKASKR